MREIEEILTFRKGRARGVFSISRRGQGRLGVRLGFGLTASYCRWAVRLLAKRKINQNLLTLRRRAKRVLFVKVQGPFPISAYEGWGLG